MNDNEDIATRISSKAENDLDALSPDNWPGLWRQFVGGGVIILLAIAAKYWFGAPDWPIYIAIAYTVIGIAVSIRARRKMRQLLHETRLSVRRRRDEFDS